MEFSETRGEISNTLRSSLYRYASRPTYFPHILLVLPSCCIVLPCVFDSFPNLLSELCIFPSTGFLISSRILVTQFPVLLGMPQQRFVLASGSENRVKFHWD